MRVAVTGGIADGKSTVCEILREMGYSVVGADEIARQLLEDPEVIDEVIENIGSAFVQSGKVDRDTLRKAISADPELRKTLNAVVHPRVMGRVLESTGGTDITFAEVPLLIETATQGKFDEVWVVCAGKDLQLGRLKERLGSQEQAEEMLATQIPTEAKLAFADRVVRTNEPLEAVRIAIARHVKELVEG